jgi:hypothetical protein
MSDYTTFLAGLSSEQRAEWDRCVELFGKKFGAEIKEEQRIQAEREEHDCMTEQCEMQMLQKVIDGQTCYCDVCMVMFQRDNPEVHCKHAAYVLSEDGLRDATTWAREEIALMSQGGTP